MKSQIVFISVATVVIISTFVYLMTLNKQTTTVTPETSSSKQAPTPARFAHINYTDFVTTLEKPDTVLLDIRTPEEYKAGHIADSVNIDFYAANFKDLLNNLDKNKEYAIYCRSGNRSEQALVTMQSLGFKNASGLAGGIATWKGTLIRN